MAATLFDLSPYHIELETDPTTDSSRVPTADYRGRSMGDVAWLKTFSITCFVTANFTASPIIRPCSIGIVRRLRSLCAIALKSYKLIRVS